MRSLRRLAGFILKVEAEGYADRVLFVDIPVLKAHDVQWPNYVRHNNYFYPGEILSAQPVTSSASGTTENIFTSLNEDICTVDEGSGEITALAAGVCLIRLTVRAEGHLDQMIDRMVPVDVLKLLNGTIEWGDFDALDPTAATGQVGGTSVLGAPTARATDEDGTAVNGLVLSIEHTSGDCAYSFDGSTHNIEFTAGTECVLRVTATASSGRGFRELVEEFRYTPPLASFYAYLDRV